MKFINLFFLAAATVAAPAPQHSDAASNSKTLSASKATIAKMQKTYETNTYPLLTGKCTKDNVRVRKNWSALCKQERHDYLKAVRCLHDKPAVNQVVDGLKIDGIRNRADEFVYAHVNQTNFVHVSGLLLPWHRQYVAAYEEALRSECAYDGSFPYWDWAEHSDDQTKSAVFDGSETSFGGNGQAVPHGPSFGFIPGILLNGTTPLPVTRDPGTGGGCVTNGGLGNYTVNLGPVVPANNTPDNLYGYKYNPRCLSRDMNNTISQTLLNYTAVASLLSNPDIHSFRPNLDMNMHPTSHRMVGNELFDLFTSPNDPVFFLLHSQIDRIWTIWQGQDYATRMNALDGTVTFLNTPPSANATLNTIMKMGVAGGDMKIGESMNAVGGNYCYMYK